MDLLINSGGMINVNVAADSMVTKRDKNSKL